MGNITKNINDYLNLNTSKNIKKPHYLILHNDDINSFNYIVESLVEICGHDKIQAEQCALLAHLKGKCEIKKGDLSILNPLKIELEIKGINTSIN